MLLSNIHSLHCQNIVALHMYLQQLLNIKWTVSGLLCKIKIKILADLRICMWLKSTNCSWVFVYSLEKLSCFSGNIKFCKHRSVCKHTQYPCVIHTVSCCCSLWQNTSCHDGPSCDLWMYHHIPVSRPSVLFSIQTLHFWFLFLTLKHDQFNMSPLKVTLVFVLIGTSHFSFLPLFSVMCPSSFTQFWHTY